MSLRDILILKKLGLGIITFTGALFIIMGGWLMFSILSEPQLTLTNAADIEQVKEELTSRSPSSVPTSLREVGEQEFVEVTRQNTRIETVKLGCLKDGSSIELKSQAKQLRLKGQLCPGLKVSPSESSIVNRANGFEATLFTVGHGGFSSDYISLDEGTNQLLLQMTDGNGARFVTELKITR